MEPSAEMDTTESVAVHATPQIASACAAHEHEIRSGQGKECGVRTFLAVERVYECETLGGTLLMQERGGEGGHYHLIEKSLKGQVKKREMPSAEFNRRFKY
jgi:hypothetical protein